MPELPEVETIVNQLNSMVKNKEILSLEDFDSSMVDSKIKDILPAKINNVFRRGKSIIIELNNGKYLLTHLRMTGHFRYFNKDYSQKPFLVAKFLLNDGSVLAHYSIRKFGSIKLVDSNGLRLALSKLGVEPLSEQFTLEHFNELLLKKQKSNIKNFLMDQSLIAGIGNIYAIEALYLSNIDPQRKIISFSSPEIKKLYNQVRKVLLLAVEKKGSTVDNYAHVEGSGGYQNHLTVYGKKCCPLGHEVKKISLGGRGTYYCPECQR